MIKELLLELWEDIRRFYYLPWRCRNACELVGLCRDPKRKYRCGRRGCLLLWQKEQDEKEG